MLHAVYWFLSGARVIDTYNHKEHVIGWAEEGFDGLAVHCTDGKTYYHSEMYFADDNYNKVYGISRR